MPLEAENVQASLLTEPIFRAQQNYSDFPDMIVEYKVIRSKGEITTKKVNCLKELKQNNEESVKYHIIDLGF